MRDIIIEGCDGTGKDTLIQGLMKGPLLDRVTLHPRASTSLGGPVDSLDEWVENTTAKIMRRSEETQSFVFNRHPLVSERIYAAYRFNKRGLSGKFKDSHWVNAQRVMISPFVILVICQPRFETVKRNIDKAPGMHMPGVVENLAKIYAEYQQLMWPGLTLRYNYMCDTPDSLMRNIRRLNGAKNG